MASEGTRDFFRVIASYFLPPLGVFLQVGLGVHFWINLVLFLMGGFPGIVHAIWVVASIDEDGGEAPQAMPTFIALCLGFVLPPVAVYLRKGVLTALLNFVLWCFGLFPGMIHAAWVICQANTDD